jgi:hypothetical protein
MMSDHPDKVIKSWSSTTLLRTRLTVLDLILGVFLIAYGLVGMRNFDLHMANMHQDDGPILFAHAFKDPSLFKGDFQVGAPLQFRVSFRVATTAMNWIPALLWRYLDIDPYPTTWLITLLQGVLLGLTAYVLTLTVTRERTAGALAMVFAYIASPWHWSLANYGNGPKWTFTPYPGNLVLPFIMLSFVCLIRERTPATLLLLMVAGLIHPAMVVYTCVVVGVYWLWEGICSQDWDVMVRRLMGLGLAGVITILPSLLVRLSISGAPLPHAEIIAGLRQNGHIVPWSGVSARWEYSWSTVLKWLVLAALSWRWRAEFPRSVQRLWSAAVLGASLLSLSHVVGVAWEIPTLMSLIGSRAFQIPTLVSLPLVIYYWLAHIRSGDWAGATLSILCLAIPLYAAEYGLIWLLIIGLLLVDASQGHLSIWSFDLPRWGRHTLRVTAALVLVAWSASFLTIPLDQVPKPLLETLSQLTWGVMGAIPEQSERMELIVTIALLGLMIWGFGRSVRQNRSADYNALCFGLISLIIILCASKFLWKQWQVAENERVSNITKLDVQLWAREHTPPSSLFVTHLDGWRTMSLRRKLSPFTRESYAYIVPRQAKEHRDRLLAFYGISAQEGRELRGSGVKQMERDRYWNFRESDFLRFASEFGATHLVLPDRYIQSLPLVYQNRDYIVYRLEPYSPLELELVRQKVETILADALLDLRSTRIVTEGEETYIVAKAGGEVKVEGTAQVADGPWDGSSALVVEDQTRLNGPPSALELSEGSLSVWARLTDPGKKYSTLVRMNSSNDLYIYHKEADGRFIVYYNGVRLGRTSVAITDHQWHHYVFTWRDGQQKFYIDGLRDLSAEVPASVADTELFAIGWLGNRDGNQWGGLLADLVTLDRPLSSDEVRTLCQVGLSIAN